MADSLLSIANSAIRASQYAISTVSSNIANANTEGYRLRTVTMTETDTVNIYGYVTGTGVNAEEAARAFNSYLEELFLAKYAGYTRYETLSQWLESVETLTSQDEDTGLVSVLEDYFQAWSDVAADPDDDSAITVLQETASSLASMINSLAQDLESTSELIEQSIASGVDEVNTISAALAELNTAIAADQDNASLLDERDLLVRQLSEYLDVDVQYQGDGQVNVYTCSGLPLVFEDKSYELSYESSKAWSSLTADSTFDGAIYFDGSSSNELTIEVVDAGAADGTATFKVSYDGGETWLTDDDGDLILYSADAESGAVEIDGVDIWFGSSTDDSAASSGALASGDTFTVMAKSGVYWYRTTSSFVNITPVEDSTGGDTSGRLTGGSLAGLCEARDACIGSYLDELESFAEALIWETNYAYSQGASSDPLTSAYGEYSAEDTSSAVSASGLAYADYVTEGSFSLALYDSDSGESLGVTAVDFSSIIPPGSSTFDPAVHSLEDVATAINATFSGQVTATVEDGTLKLESADGVSFSFAGDTTGLLAATGLNVFFTGTDAGDIAVDSDLLSGAVSLNTGVVDASGEVDSGDNTTALALADLADREVSIHLSNGKTTTSTLQDFFGDMVSQVGADLSTAESRADTNQALAESLDEEQESASGVSLDEELVKLELYQRMYQAASQVIAISEELFETLINIV